MKAFHLNDIGIDALREVELDSPAPASGEVLVHLKHLEAAAHFGKVVIELRR